MEAFNPVNGATIVLFTPLVTANGVPLISVLVASVASVPQINEFRVLLAPPFITVFSCAETLVNAVTELEITTGTITSTLVLGSDRVIPEAFDASKA